MRLTVLPVFLTIVPLLVTSVITNAKKRFTAYQTVCSKRNKDFLFPRVFGFWLFPLPTTLIAVLKPGTGVFKTQTTSTRRARPESTWRVLSTPL